MSDMDSFNLTKYPLLREYAALPSKPQDMPKLQIREEGHFTQSYRKGDGVVTVQVWKFASMESRDRWDALTAKWASGWFSARREPERNGVRRFRLKANSYPSSILEVAMVAEFIVRVEGNYRLRAAPGKRVSPDQFRHAETNNQVASRVFEELLRRAKERASLT